ncbi:MAG: FGGY-family carbohydrate kinase, partial [Gemmatimonadaceae bacterium]
WYLMGVALSAGGAFAWYREQFARELASASNANERLVAEASAVPRGADGLTFLPYLQGERTPHRDASARGVLLGLSLAHQRRHVTRAVLEGICFALRDSLAILRELGVTPDDLLLTGGGARSAFVRTLQAEVLGLPVATANREEGPAYGAALLAAVGAGAFPDLESAVSSTLSRSVLEHPPHGAHAEYDDAYRRFRQAYGATRAQRG